MIKNITRSILITFGALMISACSVFGRSDVEVANYDVLQQDGKIEVRNYAELILVSTSMNGGIDNDDGAFNRLFRYISGENKAAKKIDMTAPVFMNPDESTGKTIDMTSPVLTMQSQDSDNWTMSFVLPDCFSYDTAPRPTNPDVKLNRVTNLTVATIRFNGLLGDENIQKHKNILEQWITNSTYVIAGPHTTAGYNPPWTIPIARRNEVLIPVTQG